MKRILATLATVMIIAGVASCGAVAFADPVADSAPAGEGPAAAPSAPDGELAGPCPAGMECNPDGSLKEPPDAEPSLADLFKALQTDYDALKAARAAGDASAERVALWGTLGALTMLLLFGLKYLSDKYGSGKLKRYLPWVALAVAAASGFFDAMVMGSGVLMALLTATGPVMAVLLHELGEGWTGKRALAHAQAAGKRRK